MQTKLTMRGADDHQADKCRQLKDASESKSKLRSTKLN